MSRTELRFKFYFSRVLFENQNQKNVEDDVKIIDSKKKVFKNKIKIIWDFYCFTNKKQG